MLGNEPLSNLYQSPSFHHNGKDDFHLGHFDRFIHGYGEIVSSKSGLRYIFGPESIDLGPCCNPCDENWEKILKNEDVLFFSQGYTFSCGNVQTAKHVIIPGTYNDHKFLGVVLRERHPSSAAGSTAAFLCPPFGIIKFHKFAFGYDSDILWPPKVGARFWVWLCGDKSSTRVWKVEKRADNVEFGHESRWTNIPKIHLWQWNNTFNESGIFAITDSVLKTYEGMAPSEEIKKKRRDDTKLSTSLEAQNAPVNSAAINLLLKILNDEVLRDFVVERHQEAFKDYIMETCRF